MPAINSNLRLNMTGAEADPALRAKRYRAAIDMAAYADALSGRMTDPELTEEHFALGIAALPEVPAPAGTAVAP